MTLLRTALNQARTSRLMRVALVVWVAYAALAIVGSVALLFSDPASAAFGLATIPLAGLFLWFIAGSVRWIFGPKG